MMLRWMIILDSNFDLQVIPIPKRVRNDQVLQVRVVNFLFESKDIFFENMAKFFLRKSFSLEQQNNQKRQVTYNYFFLCFRLIEFVSLQDLTLLYKVLQLEKVEPFFVSQAVVFCIFPLRNSENSSVKIKDFVSFSFLNTDFAGSLGRIFVLVLIQRS